jgi:hypothetical protein
LTTNGASTKGYLAAAPVAAISSSSFSMLEAVNNQQQQQELELLASGLLQQQAGVCIAAAATGTLAGVGVPSPGASLLHAPTVLNARPPLLAGAGWALQQQQQQQAMAVGQTGMATLLQPPAAVGVPGMWQLGGLV